MTTITGDPGNRAAKPAPPGPSLRGAPAAPGNLTAVPHADQNPSSPPRPAGVRPVRLAELARTLGIAEAVPAPAGGGAPDADVAVTGITNDSRAVRPGDVYAALPGARFHGADFAAQAASRGAVAALCDPAGAERCAAAGLAVLTVPEPRRHLGALAVAIYGDPGQDLLQLGITGTSGKTTTAYLIEGGLRAAAKDAELTGLIGTVETRIGDERLKAQRTTPEATELQALFGVMRERGVTAVAMEVSSHALVMGRVDGCVFDVAVFTNLSPEHLDFHTDMEDYFQAKAQLFTPERSRAAVVNLDDDYGQRLAREAGVPVTTYSAEGHPDAHWRAEDVEVGPLGSVFTAVGPAGEAVRAAAPLPGPFNVSNTLAAITALVAAGVDPQTAADGVAGIPGVPGRLERVDAGQPYLAVVDYAHKPDAVESVLRALRRVTEGSVHAVLGCGGDRDPYKRGPMGAALARLADTAVLTSDNPRSEDPLAILAAMLAGAAEVPTFERGTVLLEEDRAAAITAAVARAQPGDAVIIAGKGHEVGQDVAGVVRAFDDREVLRAAIEARLRGEAAAGARETAAGTDTAGTGTAAGTGAGERDAR
ncbi:UDP-N-acetylmuramoyl-L-alanyl-D-glutamate--2,6-diaminopimelate ligase [Streptomyces sp. TRM 70351]|uniref:UDP-N-acetylmuramoyl-L-alanyl-D-glutamate--2, 6-diaminopimelate ligase n=1 Tax=Streptomyces sp. TRM 70351 TaxID=3116552 RepID=UPI002E7AFCFE|nr:UDP-N-acetylmuramoyl-L-alanyl-D-glutamate--2,6-diaminopimelate ligase [Streptomyces sp. TRM 70351]MEE1928756.1 UDP-N-acetylmuramoyl-L-alanyl-D-glutamate--2,6-diaminopimelate ligase [Streptomyces sp. TRM 70351]